MVLSESYLPADTSEPVLETTVGGVLREAAELEPDRVALGHQGDARAEADFLRHGGTRGECDELIVCAPVHFR